MNRTLTITASIAVIALAMGGCASQTEPAASTSSRASGNSTPSSTPSSTPTSAPTLTMHAKFLGHVSDYGNLTTSAQSDSDLLRLGKDVCTAFGRGTSARHFASAMEKNRQSKLAMPVAIAATQDLCPTYSAQSSRLAVLRGQEIAQKRLAAAKAAKAEASKLAAVKAAKARAARAEAAKARAAKREAAARSAAQQNAIGSAYDYLEYAGFSRSGLIEQLKFDDYTTTDATYAADHVRVDYRVQATRAAKSYLHYSHFSRVGLIEQLEYDGFTQAQAIFGVNHNGL